MTELENAQCPVFMTANRPDYFDSALLSRVTLRVRALVAMADCGAPRRIPH